MTELFKLDDLAWQRFNRTYVVLVKRGWRGPELCERLADEIVEHVGRW